MNIPVEPLEKPLNQLEIANLEISRLKNEIVTLKEQLGWFHKQVFGQKTEKIIDTNSLQLVLPLELQSFSEESVKSKQVAGHTRNVSKKNSDKLSFPDDLPIEKIILDLKEDEKICPVTGKKLIQLDPDVTQKLAYKPGSYYIKEIIRLKYASPKDVEEQIYMPPLIESLFPRCKVDESFLANIIVKKFADHLPLYRQVEMLSRENIHITRQLLSQLVVKCGLALKPIYDEMSRQVLNSQNVFIDEVPIDMLKPGKGKVHQAYMWVMVGGQEINPAYRIYNFRTDRCHNNATDLLTGYQGVLHSDKYGAYEALACKKQFVWCLCWAHIRRKFIDGCNGDSSFCKLILRKIRYLYLFEKIAWKRSAEERLRIRKKYEIPIIDEIILLVKNKVAQSSALPKSKFKDALHYVLSSIPYLKNYTMSAYAHIDNNVAERAVRPLAIGRKNWLFLGSEHGGEAAAVLFSLVQTCRALKINPQTYLEDIMRRLMSHNFKVIAELLPDKWAEIK